MVYDAVLIDQELIISVGTNTFKTKGILVLSQFGYLRVLGAKTLILLCWFSLKNTKSKNSLLLLSRMVPLPSIFFHQASKCMLLVIKQES